jgi:glyoxylase-like metal-dependent hydrolase (beta-lactamase superfamily II)
MGIKQIKVGYDNFSYILYCTQQAKAAIVDPGFDAKKLLGFLSTNKLTLEYLILTHYHHDHTSECKTIKGQNPSVKIIASEGDGKHLYTPPDIAVSDGSQVKLGTMTLDFLLTPGHTPGGICIVVDNQALLTGDTLFIGDCGRTDLPGGNVEQMFYSLHEKIMSLPDSLIVYPGHDYGATPYDTLGHQKHTNKTMVAKNIHDFSMIP